MAANSVALILGVGPRIGASVANKLASQGYKVALVSRSAKGANTATGQGFLFVQADLTQSDSVPALFKAVESEFHAAPNVVIYNAAARIAPPVEGDWFSNPADTVVSDFNVNVLSAYIAAQQAVQGWEMLPKEVKKTFIYTGNAANTMIAPTPATVNLGMGKSTSSYWMGLADSLYKAQGFRFFYADERANDGNFKGQAIDGDAHAEFYAFLIKHEGNVP